MPNRAARETPAQEVIAEMRLLRTSMDQLLSAVQRLAGLITLALSVPLRLPTHGHAPSTSVPRFVGHEAPAPDAQGSASGYKRDPRVPSFLHPGGIVRDSTADEWRCLLCRKAKTTGALKMANASHCAVDEHKAAMVWADGDPTEAEQAALDALETHHPTLYRRGSFLP